MSSTKLQSGKIKAMIDFCYHAALSYCSIRKPEYELPFPSNLHDAAKYYIIPIVGEILNLEMLTNENPFDEAYSLLNEKTDSTILDQLNLDEANNGNELEMAKFFVALVYEFKTRRSTEMPRLCQPMNKVNQLEICHVISEIDDAIKWKNPNWWEILYEEFNGENLSELAQFICNKPMTPRRTPARPIATSRPVCDSPISTFLDSPKAKDCIIQEYERRMKNIEAHVQDLQSLYDEAQDENLKLKAANQKLQDELSASKQPVVECGEKCPNLTKASKLRIALTAAENRLKSMAEDYELVYGEYKTLQNNENELQNENKRLMEENKYQTNELDRLKGYHNSHAELQRKYNELQEKHDQLAFEIENKKTLDERIERLTAENKDLWKQIEGSGSVSEQSRKTQHALKKEIETLQLELEQALRDRETLTQNSESLQSNLQQMTIKYVQMKSEAHSWQEKYQEELARSETKENKMPEAQKNNIELEIARDNLRQVSEENAKHKKMLKKCEDQLDDARVQIENLTQQLNEYKRQQKTTSVKTNRRSERGPFHESHILSSASSIKTNGARYSNTTVDPQQPMKFGKATGDIFSAEDRSSVLKERNQKNLPHMRTSIIDAKVAL
ncbi:hypothetical protein M3Y98_00935200 [Aphelenchoides besseyi]|nr:hypothetical protein M3Y98_00935200 [Aphelenchoides besseyi]KAI6194274.1 hypothetical protein M3Y96_01107700 [Aphelenchoides besseyi]